MDGSHALYSSEPRCYHQAYCSFDERLTLLPDMQLWDAEKWRLLEKMWSAQQLNEWTMTKPCIQLGYIEFVPLASSWRSTYRLDSIYSNEWSVLHTGDILLLACPYCVDYFTLQLERRRKSQMPASKRLYQRVDSSFFPRVPFLISFHFPTTCRSSDAGTWSSSLQHFRPHVDCVV